ncbi:MAG: hypothetical protein SOW59_00890 [Corynebacterium sp.]|nr:hypothetical protein [Corynebacterium sp.]
MSRREIIDLRHYRRGARRSAILRREPETVILAVSNVQPDAEVHRHIGVSDALTFAELFDVLSVAFSFPDEESPWHFYQVSGGIDGGARTRGERIDPTHQISEFLWMEGDRIDLYWGLWDFQITLVEVYPRDAGSPHALCVGGSGSFLGTTFDLTEVNAKLTGQEVIAEVLIQVTPMFRSVIQRSRLYDFVPLLRALDVGKTPNLSPEVATVLATLPHEATPKGIDAFCSVVLGLLCMGEQDLEDEVTVTLMSALGWASKQGQALTAEEVRAECGASLSVLEKLKVTGPEASAPVDRLDILRALVSAVG